MKRLAVVVALVTVWSAFGLGVNRYLASRKSNNTVNRAAVMPPEASPQFSLPGTIYISQAGHLYRFTAGHFSDMGLPGATGAWIQPARATSGQLLVVARAAEYSDIYLVDAGTGAVVKRLTSNAATDPKRVELNAWSFWPHLAADGATVVSNYDGPKSGTTFEVHLAVWTGPLGGVVQRRQWTDPNLYTGGDVAPVPLPSGGIVYAKFALNDASQIVSRIAVVSAPGADPVYLTSAQDDCSEPALSPDGGQLAVICTADSQSARLEVIPLVNGVPGAAQVMARNCLCASPAWSPDGTGLLYLAPEDATGHFQLWWINGASSSRPAAPRMVTSHLDFDATSPPLWSP